MKIKINSFSDKNNQRVVKILIKKETFEIFKQKKKKVSDHIAIQQYPIEIFQKKSNSFELRDLIFF